MNTIVNFNGLTGSKLVAAYNEMLAIAVKHSVPLYKDARQVTRFADTAAGIKRCEKLQEALKAAGVLEGAASETETATEFPAQSTESNQGPDTASPDATTSSEETPEGSEGNEEADDMARKAKKKAAARAPAKKKGGGAPRARSTDGSTIREMTEEYNAIVAKMTKAQKEAAPFAKHHTSQFESKEKAKVQLAKLKKAIAKA